MQMSRITENYIFEYHVVLTSEYDEKSRITKKKNSKRFIEDNIYIKIH